MYDGSDQSIKIYWFEWSDKNVTHWKFVYSSRKKGTFRIQTVEYFNFSGNSHYIVKSRYSTTKSAIELVILKESYKLFAKSEV
jgi:hypothetical protein